MKNTKKALLTGILIGFILAVVLGMTAVAGYHFLSFIRMKSNREQTSDDGKTEEQIEQLYDNSETEIPKADLADDNNTANTQTQPMIQKQEFLAYQTLEMYTYQDLCHDINLLEQAYFDLTEVNSLGVTADGRNLYHVIVGNQNAEYKIFINAGIHGREYMTCQLVMKQLITYLDHIVQKDSYAHKEYGMTAYEQMWEQCAIHIVPMVNPDGITISQYGVTGLEHQVMREQVESIAMREGGYGDVYYYKRWKSNANGVDLNRNFDALWETYDDGVGMPSADHYKGIYTGSEAESAAMIMLTEKEKFHLTVSYHTQGSVIYWYFGQEGELYEKTKAAADLVSLITGYPTDANYEHLDPAGYKDWCISKKGIPGLTIEIGTETSPVPASQFDTVWNQNQNVWEELVCWISK